MTYLFSTQKFNYRDTIYHINYYYHIGSVYGHVIYGSGVSGVSDVVKHDISTRKFAGVTNEISADVFSDIKFNKKIIKTQQTIEPELYDIFDTLMMRGILC